MMITVIFLAIVFVIAMVYFSKKLNSYSEEKYDYEPINMLNILLMITPFILLGCGFFIFKSADNQLLSILFSTIIIISNFLYIKSKTDIGIAFGSVFILIFAGFLFFLLIFASSRRDEHYYD